MKFTAVHSNPKKYTIERIANIYYARAYGFTPSSSPQNNVSAWNSIPCGSTVKIDIPGTYEIADTLWLCSNTSYEFCAGCTIKKVAAPNYFAFVFANAGMKTKTRNSNITIIGNGLILDINGIDDPSNPLAIYHMNGQINFLRVDGLTIDDIECTNYPNGQQFGHFSDINNVSFSNFVLVGQKDALHFETCHDVALTDIYTDAKDDAIAFMASDYGGYNTAVGHVENITITRWTDKSTVNPGGSVLRLGTASWKAWLNGNTYKRGDLCNNAGYTYSKDNDNSIIGTVAPVHTVGSVLGADGILWTALHVAIGTEGCIRNMTLKDCVFEGTPGSVIFYEDIDDTQMRCTYPGTEGNNYMDNFVLDNITWTPEVDSLTMFSSDSWVRKISIINSNLTLSKIATLIACNNPLKTIQLDEVIIDNCIIQLPATSKVIYKYASAVGRLIDIIDSDIDMNSSSLMYLEGTEHIDFTITNSIIDDIANLFPIASQSVDIVATGTVFSNVTTILNLVSGSAYITFTSVGCTYTDPSGSYLWSRASGQLVIDVSNSIAAVTQSKIANSGVIITRCDFYLPVIIAARIDYFDGTKVVLDFNLPLDPTSTPATTAFALSGKVITSVVISGVNIFLTVSVAYIGADVVTVGYTVPLINKLRSTSLGLAPAFAGYSVLNILSKTNLILNGSFEGAFVAGLAASFTDDGSLTKTEENVIVFQGVKAQRFTANFREGIYQYFAADLTAGKTYRFTGRYYNVTGKALFEKAGVCVLTPTQFDAAEISPVLNIWHTLTEDFVCSGTGWFSLRLYAGVDGSEVIYDSLLMYEI